VENFGLNEMQAIQKELQEKYKDKWRPLSPEKGRDQLLWMMIEAGEIADIIKKSGYDGCISVEFEGPEDCFLGCSQGMATLRDLFK